MANREGDVANPYYGNINIYNSKRENIKKIKKLGSFNLIYSTYDYGFIYYIDEDDNFAHIVVEGTEFNAFLSCNTDTITIYECVPGKWIIQRGGW